MQTGDSVGKRFNHTLQALRPLFWWLALVFVLFAVHTHQRLSEQTRLLFSASIRGQPVLDEAQARVDNRPVASGDRIAIGWHTLFIIHPKAAPFSTNLFIWYGPHDLGNVDLKRARGVLDVSADPRAPLLSVRGPEWNVALSNSTGVAETVPTDDYSVLAQYRHHTENLRLRVLANMTNQLKIAPRFGALQLSCNQSNASFKLLGANDEFVESGDFPAEITELPEGGYSLVAEHHGHRRNERLRVAPGTTNFTNFRFSYGGAVLETTPAGASVAATDGREFGTTPLTLSELEPGLWNLLVKLDNYDAVSVRLQVTAGETNIVRTNLVSLSYERAIRRARELMVAGEYEKASEAVTDALRADPGNATAMALQREASGRGSISRAKALGSQGDYIAGSKELERALANLPEDTEAKRLLTDFRQHEQEQIARQYQEHIESLKELFVSFTGKISGTAFVETHELKSAKPAKEAQAAIVGQFSSVAPAFKLSHVGWTNTMFYMDGDQEVSGGGRLCLLVGGETKDGETQVLFKVIEFKGEAFGLRLLGAVIGAATSTKFQSGYQPINPSDTKLGESDKNRVAEGVRIVTERIQQALR